MTPTIVVVGAGAAGVMAAIHAAGPGRRVVLLERMPDGGRKILISGGGRCNVLPGVLDESRFVTDSSPHTLRNVLRSWTLAEQRQFFERDVGLPLVLEKETGKLFPVANKSRAVRDGLAALARARGVECITNARAVDLVPGSGQWRIALADGGEISPQAVVVPSGGLSVPQTGSDGFGFEILARLGHTIHATYPALTPIVCEPAAYGDLAGVSRTATVRAGDAVAAGGFLFTHHGYSGPAVLDVSHVLIRHRDTPLIVQWTELDHVAWETELRPSPRQVGSILRQHLPARLADRLLVEVGTGGDTQLAQLRREDRQRLIVALTRFPLPWTGHGGYRKAEVTGGGVSLGDVNPRTMESRRTPGLFLAGELLDAFGPIGGYNFVWAWVTGRLAGLGAAASITTI